MAEGSNATRSSISNEVKITSRYMDVGTKKKGINETWSPSTNGTRESYAGGNDGTMEVASGT